MSALSNIELLLGTKAVSTVPFRPNPVTNSLGLSLVLPSGDSIRRITALPSCGASGVWFSAVLTRDSVRRIAWLMTWLRSFKFLIVCRNTAFGFPLLRTSSASRSLSSQNAIERGIMIAKVARLRWSFSDSASSGWLDSESAH